MYRTLDLFAGIGGFSLGLERTGGFQTVAFCEIDKKAQLVLKKHWPGVPIYEDIKDLTSERLQADEIIPDVITGGFPCQDISGAGKGKGIVGERSGLWSEMFRLIRDVRPTWAIIENVSALRSKGLTLVLQDLYSVGYCAEWHCIPASAVGAPHQRDRIWIIANPNSQQLNSLFNGSSQEGSGEVTPTGGVHSGNQGSNRPKNMVAHTRCVTPQVSSTGRFPAIQIFERSSWWEIEPNVGRVADGVPKRVDRLKQLGNSVVPQIPELLGRAILSTNALHEG